MIPTDTIRHSTKENFIPIIEMGKDKYYVGDTLIVNINIPLFDNEETKNLSVVFDMANKRYISNKKDLPFPKHRESFGGKNQVKFRAILVSKGDFYFYGNIVREGGNGQEMFKLFCHDFSVI